MMRLYDIDLLLRAVIRDGDVFVDSETGEIFSPQALDRLLLARDEKLEGCLIVAKEYEAEAKALADEIKVLTARKNAAQNHSEWLKGYVQQILAGEKFKTSKVSVTYRSSKAVNLTDWRAVPEEYYRDQTEKDICKTAIMEVLKQGGTVPGAEIVEKKSMVVK